MNELTGSQVIGLLQDMLYDLHPEDPRHAALTQAVDALESVTIVTVTEEDGAVQVTQLHPLLDVEIVHERR